MKIIKISSNVLMLLTILSVVCPILVVSVLAADIYPSKPIKLIVPFAAGGPTDIMGRVLAPALSERLGQTVILENRGGGASVPGTEYVAKSEPNGYTLVFVDTAFTTLPTIRKLPYDPLKSFAPIAVVSNSDSSLCVHPKVPANSVKEFIELAKQKPGKLIVGTGGMGGGGHFGIELFQMMADIDLKLVHFKGGGPAIIDLLGGHSDALLGSLAASLPHIKSGKLRILGTSKLERSRYLPNVPTIAESGLPGFQYNSYRGVLAPAGTPAPIIDRLSKELKTILDSEEVKKAFMNTGAEVTYNGPIEYGLILKKEITDWTNVAKKANIKMQ